MCSPSFHSPTQPALLIDYVHSVPDPKRRRDLLSSNKHVRLPENNPVGGEHLMCDFHNGDLPGDLDYLCVPKDRGNGDHNLI